MDLGSLLGRGAAGVFLDLIHPLFCESGSGQLFQSSFYHNTDSGEQPQGNLGTQFCRWMAARFIKASSWESLLNPDACQSPMILEYFISHKDDSKKMFA